MTEQSESGVEDRKWRPRGNKWLIAVVVTLAAFMEILDTTIVVVALRILLALFPSAMTIPPGA